MLSPLPVAVSAFICSLGLLVCITPRSIGVMSWAFHGLAGQKPAEADVHVNVWLEQSVGTKCGSGAGLPN